MQTERWATLETVEIVESMHLGEKSGIVQEDAVTDSSRKYNPVHKFVHEFCKLFGSMVVVLTISQTF